MRRSLATPRVIILLFLGFYAAALLLGVSLRVAGLAGNGWLIVGGYLVFVAFPSLLFLLALARSAPVIDAEAMRRTAIKDDAGNRWRPASER